MSSPLKPKFDTKVLVSTVVSGRADFRVQSNEIKFCSSKPKYKITQT